MAVKNDCFGGTSISDGYIYTVADFNDTYDAVYDCQNYVLTKNIESNTESILENSINIAKLQYCESLTDIDHDYMVVDVFTDSTGYNNTISTTESSSCYFSSDFNGLYSNFCIDSTSEITSVLVANCIGGTANDCTAYSTYNICVCHNSSGASDISICGDDRLCLDSVDGFCFKLYYCISAYDDYSNGIACARTLCWEDSKEIHTYGSVTCELTFCYKYLKMCGTSFNVYCDNSYLTTTSLTNFPNIVLCGCGGGCWGKSCVCLYDYANFSCACNKIVSCDVDYATTVSKTYLTLDKCGDGTVVYDVYDASSTSTAIATSLAVNTLNSLDCCVECHKYDIIQCSDGASVIKSYAIAATKA